MKDDRSHWIFILSLACFAWAFLEASVWWIAPDIMICIAYAFFPRHWKLYFTSAVTGALAGAGATYIWAGINFSGWMRFVQTMPFHSTKNIQHAAVSLGAMPSELLVSAWTGIPFKLYFAWGSHYHYGFWILAACGVLSRVVRFSVALIVTVGLRELLPRAVTPVVFSVLLGCIWAGMILLFDAVVNRAAVG